jgi:hypothetical protein
MGKTHTGFWWLSLKKKPIGRPRLKQKDNIKADLKLFGRTVLA